jgi:hypothetical protein
VASVGPLLTTLTPLFANLGVGLVAGAAAVAVFNLVQKARQAVVAR